MAPGDIERWFAHLCNWGGGLPHLPPWARAYGGNTILNSFHPGGIHVLLADGSVRFVAETINFATLSRLCVRDDGEVIAEL